ncbi:undecaprenyl/decaprenyl-phosphate alpha-N-acetylglucosaminyl 1-phosphate transferase [Candidatus Pelagibacter sp.]|nr:undecaprenyl/decaprenyl-phosphate alpha-N-acetylglucosaminyl 1-phosphate transferase [Candidatus Pelagibacter sp.]
MNLYLFLIFVIFLSFLFTFLCDRNSFLMNQVGDPHQEFASNTNIPLIGGTILFLSMLLLNFLELDLIFIYLSGMFFIGFLSDLKKLNSPTLRLLLQIIMVVMCVYTLNITLTETRINFLDHLLNNQLFAIFFTSFCILIIINGSNFIDGINSLVIGYYIIISLVLFLLKNEGFIISFNFLFYATATCLIILLFFNLFNKLYMGDSGAYLLGFLFSLVLIDFYLQNNVSPFFIVLLLWYPAFECLFSILRKTNFNKSPINPDTNHLHQLIFSYFKKKNYTLLKANNITGISINIYNLIIMMISLIYPSNTQFQISLIIISLSLYTFFYMRMYKFK